MIGLRETIVNIEKIHYDHVMSLLRRVVFLMIIFFVLASFNPGKVFALSYSLIPPSGSLKQGQEVQFIITIDTGSSTVTTGSVGLSYETQYLQYITTTAGDAMNSVTVTQPSSNQLILNGTNSGGFSGQGDFAFVKFKIIADAPGSTELCALFIPTPSPTTPPGTTPNPTSPPNPTNPPTNPTSSPGTTTAPTSPPAPGSKGGTNPPASGNNSQAAIALSLGFALVMVYGVLRFFRKIKA